MAIDDPAASDFACYLCDEAMNFPPAITWTGIEIYAEKTAYLTDTGKPKCYCLICAYDGGKAVAYPTPENEDERKKTQLWPLISHIKTPGDNRHSILSDQKAKAMSCYMDSVGKAPGCELCGILPHVFFKVHCLTLTGSRNDEFLETCKACYNERDSIRTHLLLKMKAEDDQAMCVDIKSALEKISEEFQNAQYKGERSRPNQGPEVFATPKFDPQHCGLWIGDQVIAYNRCFGYGHRSTIDLRTVEEKAPVWARHHTEITVRDALKSALTKEDTYYVHDTFVYCMDKRQRHHNSDETWPHPKKSSTWGKPWGRK